MCPHCEYEPPKDPYLTWDKKRNVKEVALDAHQPHSRPDAVIVVSECPKCFEISWCHLSLDRGIRSYEVLGWSKKDAEVMRAEFIKRLKDGAVEFRDSMCSTCTHNKGVTWRYLYPRIKCSAREGYEKDDTFIHRWDDPHFGSCKKYKKLKKKSGRKSKA